MRGTWVVMIVGPTETPQVMGPFRKESTAREAAEAWNAANPYDDEESEQYTALATRVLPFSIDA